MVKTDFKIGKATWRVEYEKGRFTLRYPDGDVFISSTNRHDILDNLGRLFARQADEKIDKVIDKAFAKGQL